MNKLCFCAWPSSRIKIQRLSARLDLEPIARKNPALGRDGSVVFVLISLHATCFRWWIFGWGHMQMHELARSYTLSFVFVLCWNLCSFVFWIHTFNAWLSVAILLLGTLSDACFLSAELEISWQEVKNYCVKGGEHHFVYWNLWFGCDASKFNDVR